MSERPEYSIEHLLERAFAPIEPPQRLFNVFEQTLEEMTYAAAGELAEWELVSMRDPRNWAAPATAAVVGAGAGAALLVLHVRRRRRSERSDALEAITSAFGDAALEIATGGTRRRSNR